MILRIHPSLFWIIIIAIILILIMFFNTYFKKRQEHSFSDMITFITIVVGGVGISFILLIFAIGVIEIYIVGGAEEMSIALFTLLNGFLFGMYASILGLIPETKASWQQALLVFAFSYMALAGFGYLGIRIVCNFPLNTLLIYDTFQTNSFDGGLFFIGNIHIFSILYFATFISETEKA